MGIVAADKFVAYMMKGQVSWSEKSTLSAVLTGAGALDEQLTELRSSLSYFNGNNNSLRVTESSALALYNMCRDYVVTNGFFYNKALRPWEVDDTLLSNLDRNQSWIGWEFETGYVSAAARSEVVAHLWDNFSNTAFDSEGEGAAFGEYTFAPEEYSKYEAGTDQATVFMEYLSYNRRLCNCTSSTMIGTHVNFSIPGADNYITISAVLNHSLHYLSNAERASLFGRGQLYAGFFDQGNYVEGKLFRTTYNIERFKQYRAVGMRIVKLAEWINANVKYSTKYISNLYAILAGYQVTPLVEAVSDTNFCYEDLSDGGYVSGGPLNEDDYDYNDSDYPYDYEEDEY